MKNGKPVRIDYERIPAREFAKITGWPEWERWWFDCRCGAEGVIVVDVKLDGEKIVDTELVSTRCPGCKRSVTLE
jgi:hypothetical protein